MTLKSPQDTIAAIATAPGKGGIGVVRVSGLRALEIAEQITGFTPAPRQAKYAKFRDVQQDVIDEGIVLYFKAPHSFTGEDVIEFQGHGGPFVLDLLLKRILSLSVRLAEPGEFSLRAYLNNKRDLAQSEAIADLINASSSQAAKAAMHSLQGQFSENIHRLVDQLIYIRTYIEAGIDFSDEEIDLLGDGVLLEKVDILLKEIQAIYQKARQGKVLTEGITLVILGQPNVGKSSLLNQLAQENVAIVTDIPGTTRDILKENIQLDGIPIKIIDTAGLRNTEDRIEQEGILRALSAAENADHLFIVVDQFKQSQNEILKFHQPILIETFKSKQALTIIRNKTDLYNQLAKLFIEQDIPEIHLSAQTGEGIEILRDYLKHKLGFQQTDQGIFTARQRHLSAIQTAEQFVLKAKSQMKTTSTLELIAEDLRQAQIHLNEITGEFSSDDLLGEIFSTFCIGK